MKIDPDGVPVFSNIQISDYGMPELWGYNVYRVSESLEADFVTDYKMEQSLYFKKIHRYSRVARFKVCLFNILGDRGIIPQHVKTMVKLYLKPDSMDKWNDTRKILKHFKQQKHYDQIPSILRCLSYGRCFPSLTCLQFEGLICDFQHLSEKFDRTKTDYKRRYFPNIRFIVLKLLEMHGIRPNYPIPLVRTSRKMKSLQELWDLLIKLEVFKYYNCSCSTRATIIKWPNRPSTTRACTSTC